MNIKFDKDSILEEINRIRLNYNEYNQSYDCGEEGCLELDEFEERVQNALDFVNSLTEDKLQSAIKGFTMKKNGKPRKGTISNIFIFDVGYWFVEWYVTYGTYKIVARSINETDMEVVIERVNINSGEYPYVTKLD